MLNVKKRKIQENSKKNRKRERETEKSVDKSGFYHIKT